MHFNSEFETVPNVINEPFGSMYSAAMIVRSVLSREVTKILSLYII